MAGLIRSEETLHFGSALLMDNPIPLKNQGWPHTYQSGRSIPIGLYTVQVLLSNDAGVSDRQHHVSKKSHQTFRLSLSHQ